MFTALVLTARDLGPLHFQIANQSFIPKVLKLGVFSQQIKLLFSHWF
jgi:hypothetical protein